VLVLKQGGLERVDWPPLDHLEPLGLRRPGVVPPNA